MYDDHGNYLEENRFTLDQTAQDVVFSVDVPNNAIVLTCNNLSASFFSGKFRYKEAPLLVAKGHLEVDMDKVTIGVGLQFTTQTLPDGRTVPAINSVDVNVGIDRDDISIEIWGNLWADFAAAFEIFFKSTVVQLI